MYVLFQSMSKTSFENHIALYENITILQKCDFLTVYYDINVILKHVFFSLFALMILVKYFNLRWTINAQRTNINKLTLEKEKMENKIELLEENLNVIKNLLLAFSDKVKTSDIGEIFNGSKLNVEKKNYESCEDDSDYVDEGESSDEEDDEDDEDESSDEDDEDIYEKYDKLLSDHKKLKCKIDKITDYTNLDFCRSAKIVTYIKEELKRS